MKKQDYFLRCLLVETLANIGTHFIDKETGKNDDKKILNDLLKNEEIKNRFYGMLESELQEVLKEVLKEVDGIYKK